MKTGRKPYRYEILSKNIVFVDGLTRTGKALLNNLLLGFKNISSIQFINILEQLMPLYINGEITKDAISAFLRLYFNENFYNYKLSRNINFRYDDLTSIYRAESPQNFHRNLGKTDGDVIINELRNDDTVFQFQTHDLLTHYSGFLELNINATVLELFRHPVDTIYSWYKRGWGKRFDEQDPRSGTMLFLYNESVVPHYVVGNEEVYLSLNEMEKCVFTHNLLLRKSIEQYKRLNKQEKNKILLVSYEDLLLNTDNELNRISHFLNLDKSSHISHVMIDSRVPRQIKKDERSIKLLEIKSKIRHEFYEDLMNLSKYYEDEFYELEKDN